MCRQVGNCGEGCGELPLTVHNAMFIGEYEHTIDPKGRLALPAKFRSELSGGVIVTRGLDHCLFVFTNREWEALVAKLTNLPIAQANSRAFVRLMLAGATECGLDGQGRILVPEYLRKYAGLAKEAIVAGLVHRIEIWNRESWESYKAASEASSDEIAEKLGELGI